MTDPAVAALPDLVRATGSLGPVRTVPVTSPTTGTHLLDVEDVDGESLQGNLSAAGDASRTQWAWLSGEDRARHLFAVADVLADHTRALAVTAALTTGRPVVFAATDGSAVLDAAFSAAGWADKCPALGITTAAGVAVVDHDWRTSTPGLVTRVLAHLAGGRAVVLRPRPAVAALAARLVLAATEAGLPAGLLSVAPTSAALSVSPEPAADVVLAGADLDAVTSHLLSVLAAGALGRPDGTRVLVADDVSAELLDRLEVGAAALTVGDPLDDATQVGPCPTPELAHAFAVARQRPTVVPHALPHGGWWALPAPAAAVLGVRAVHSAEEAHALLATTPATEVTVWGLRPAEVHRWRSLDGLTRLGVDAAALPDHRSTALAVLGGSS